MIKPGQIVGALAAVVCVQALQATADAPRFDRYEGIVSRMPFGVPPAAAPAPVAPVSAAKPAAPAVSFVHSLRMCAVTRSGPGGELCVGFVDTTSNRSYYMAVGESDEGITIVSADYDSERALLRKGTEEGWVCLSAGPATATGIAAAQPVPAPAVAADSSAPGAAAAVASRRGALRTVVPEYALMRRKTILEGLANSSAGPPLEEQRIE